MKKHFCRYCLKAFSTEEILKRQIENCFKINGKQRIIMPKKGKRIKFKNYERKIKSPVIIYADFESILVPKDNGKENPKKHYTNKFQKHIASSCGYKLVYFHDKFIKPFKKYLDKDAVYNFINNMIKESKCYCGVIKKHFNEELENILTKNLC